MESWQKVWREGFAPLLSNAALEALRRGLKTDDARLIQGSTMKPPMSRDNQQRPVEGACALGYARWKGDGLQTVAEIAEFFAQACLEADQRLMEPATCRFFLRWFDETPRDQVFQQLLIEVERTLALRRGLRSAAIGASVVPMEA